MRKFTAGLVMTGASILLGVGTAGAQQPGCPESPQGCTPPSSVATTTTTPSVGGRQVTPTTVGTSPRPEVAAATPEGQEGLPVTGTDAATLAGAGIVLVAGGGALVLRTRRSQADARS
jgi:LPXTG-motif cell wall-anchored protein